MNLGDALAENNRLRARVAELEEQLASRAVPEPTDDELSAFAEEEQFLLFCDTDEFIDIARSVLHRFTVAPQPDTPARGWDAQAYASMRDEVEFWKQRAAESDEALERISNDLSPKHMGEPVIAAPAPSAPGQGEDA